MENHIRAYVKGELHKYPHYKQLINDFEQKRMEFKGQPDMLQRLLATTERARFYVQAIESVMDSLSEEEHRLVELCCIRDYSPDFAAEQLRVDRSTVFRMLNGVLPRFVVRFGI